MSFHPLSLFLKLSAYLFIFSCSGSSLLRGLCSSCSEQRLLSSCNARASHSCGFSCCRARALGMRASAAAAEQRLTSCGALTLLLCGMWNLPGSSIEPMSPALQVDSLPLSHQGKHLSVQKLTDFNIISDIEMVGPLLNIADKVRAPTMSQSMCSQQVGISGHILGC